MCIISGGGTNFGICNAAFNDVDMGNGPADLPDGNAELAAHNPQYVTCKLPVVYSCYSMLFLS